MTALSQPSIASSRSGLSFRLVLVCFLALSASLPIALISIGKLLLFAAALAYLVVSSVNKRPDSALAGARGARMVLLVLAVFALSLLWTEAEFTNAIQALVKHGKLLVIVLLAALIRTPAEGRAALLAFAVGQVGLLAASWLLAAGVKMPMMAPPVIRGVVFSSYLDQGIIFATSAAVFWHLRHLRTPKPMWPGWLGIAFAIAALANVFLVLIGRTAFVVAAALAGLALLWTLPARLRLAAVVAAPTLAIAGLFLAPSLLPNRAAMVLSEMQNYAKNPEFSTSSGWRLNAWHRSVQAVAESPLAGHGVGGWTGAVKRLQGPNGTEVFGSGSLSNPHQEYLLWGVELGIAGLILLVLLLLALGLDFSGFSEPVFRAGLSVVVALAIACLFNSTIYDGLIGDYFCIVLGLLLGLGLRIRDAESTTMRHV